MNSRRNAKAAQAILESVSSTILIGLKDPRVKNVTVLDVEVSGDLRTAKVYVSVMGDERTQSLSMHGLNSARGFIQSKVADRLQTRYTPVLKFILDQGVKRSIETARLIQELEDQSRAAGGLADDGAVDDGSVDDTSADHGVVDAADDDNDVIEDDAVVEDDAADTEKMPVSEVEVAAQDVDKSIDAVSDPEGSSK